MTSIGDQAFSGCTKLASVTIPGTITSIGTFAFYNCPLNIKRLYIPKATVGASAFNGSTNLDSLTIGSLSNPLSNIFKSLSHLKYVVIADKDIQSLPAAVFAQCDSLADLTLPFLGISPTATGESAVLGVLFGTSTASNAVTQYYEEGKSKKYAIPHTLEKLTVTRPATRIEYGALYNCSFLKELTIPSSVTGLGEKSLYGCSGMEHIYAQKALPPTAYDGIAEDVSAACILHVPTGSKQYYEKRTGWKDFFFIEEEAPIQITALPVPYYGGQITGITAYNYDDEAALTANAHANYDFKCWMEGQNVVGTDREYEFTVNGARTLYAVFTPRENADENIQITPSPSSATISWTVVEDAASYELIIYADESRTQEIARFQFDADGNVLRSTSQVLSCTIPDLDAQTAYYYSLTSYDSNEYALTISNGDFETSVVTGIDNPFAVHSVRIYPNPVQAGFYVSGIEGTARLKVLDISGKLILSLKITNRDYIPTGSFPEGIYIVKVSSDKGTTERKIIKRK